MPNWISRGVAIRRSVLVLAVLPVVAQAAQDVRVVTYNTQDDVGHNQTITDANLAAVLEGIGQQKYTGDNVLQLPDIIALQETYNNSSTVYNVTHSLDTYYNTTAYAYSTYQATYYGSSPITGNGPNALIYNQNTLKLVASVGVGTPQGIVNGEYRQVVRYEFQPISDAGTNTGIFYVYDTHSKSGPASTTTTSQGKTSTDGAVRNLEAQIIRDDETTLPSTASVLYVGDFNQDGTTEAAYKTLTTAASHNGIVQGAAVDPLNLTNNYSIDYTANSLLALKTDSDTSLHYRDDLQLMTANVYNGSGGTTLQYVPNSYHPFGNSGNTSYGTSVNSTSNPALNDIIGNGPLTPATVFNAMNASAGSDHLAVVADYSIISTVNGVWLGGTGNWSNSSLWSNSLVPNSSTVEVKIDNGNSIASVVTLDQVATVQDITIDAGDTLLIGSGQSLTLASAAAPSNFNGSLVNSGTLVATAVTNTGTFSTTGNFSASGNFTNSGTASFSGSQNWSSGSILINLSGTTTFSTDAGSATSANLNITVAGGSVVFGASQHLAGLSLATGANAVSTLQSNHSNHTLLTVGSLAISGSTDSWGATLDLTNNDLDVQTGSLSDVTNQVKQGFNSGQWNGSGGILSSAAAADTQHLTALGVIQNNQNGVPIFGSTNTFDGSAVGASDILVKFTYYGDANLDGVVDGSDYSLIDSGFLTGATGWLNGDFNYDGVVNGSDYTLIDNAFNQQGASLQSQVVLASTTAQIAAVPEPAICGSLVVCGLLSRRRRKNRR